MTTLTPEVAAEFDRLMGEIKTAKANHVAAVDALDLAKEVERATQKALAEAEGALSAMIGRETGMVLF